MRRPEKIKCPWRLRDCVIGGRKSGVVNARCWSEEGVTEDDDVQRASCLSGPKLSGRASPGCCGVTGQPQAPHAPLGLLIGNQKTVVGAANLSPRQDRD